MQKTFTLDGKTYKVFPVTCFDEQYNVIVYPATYVHSGSLALQVLEVTHPEYGPVPFGTLTVYLRDEILPQDDSHAFVKNWSENDGWAMALAKKIGKDSGLRGEAGYCLAPYFEFDLKKVYA